MGKSMEKIDRIRYLVGKLNNYRDAYYNRNESLVTDKEYDLLFDELELLEEEESYVLANSPTQTVGYSVVGKLNKVTHDHKLLSLGKTTGSQEFIDYFENKPMVIMAKMDGLTCSATYEDGKLVRLETRGNGEVGEDVTHNAVAFENLPMTISYKGKLVVDGEAIITYHDFEEINKSEAVPFKNPRNLASGSVRQLDSSIAAKRHLKFVAWKLFECDNYDTLPSARNSNLGRFSILEKLGFTVVPNVASQIKTIEEFNAFADGLKHTCEDKGYPIDGLVGMFDDVDYCNNLGFTSHHPKHSLAFKFYQEDNETTLLDIEWNTSRTGLVNPVAVFEPVEIDGTTVTRASLSNVSIIKELELGIGDTITVIKANQIIPKITQNLTRSNTYSLPTTCPCCGSDVETRNDNGRETLCCTNKNCSAVTHDRLVNFVARNGMDIEGLSSERLSQFIDAGFITDFCSFYTMKEHYNELINLDRLGASSITSIIDAIEISKSRPITNVLVALGIPGIGKSSATNICNECSCVDADTFSKNPLKFFIQLCCADYDWTVAKDIGETTRVNINKYVQENENEFLRLSDILTTTVSKNSVGNGGLDGKTFCITGKLEHYANRDALVADIEKFGGVSVSGVSAKTDYLINNDIESNSSKNQKAKKFGTKIITEEQFVEMIEC